MSGDRTHTERVVLAVEAGGAEEDAHAFGADYGSVKRGRVTRRERPDLWARMKAGGLTETTAAKIRLEEKKMAEGVLKAHPAAAIFPMMSKEERAELKADIQANGYRDRHEIVVHRDGTIIDGRNRAAVCAELGIACPSVTYDKPDETILAFVLSENLHRRHLDTTQRAVVAAKMANLPKGRPAAAVNGQNCPFTPSVSQEDAAAKMGVSVRTVKTAGAVLKAAKSDPIAAQAAKAMEAGEMKLAEASRIALGKPPLPKKTPVGGGKKNGPKASAKAQPEPPADAQSLYRRGHEPKNSNEQLAQRFVISINNLHTIACQTTAAGLMTGMVEEYRKNLDISLAKALELLAAVAALHPGPEERRAEAGNGAAAAAPTLRAAEGP